MDEHRSLRSFLFLDLDGDRTGGISLTNLLNVLHCSCDDSLFHCGFLGKRRDGGHLQNGLRGVKGLDLRGSVDHLLLRNFILRFNNILNNMFS